jgi:uncharacterized protein
MSIPRFPERRLLELSDKPLFDAALTEIQPRISELTFAGLYLFRTAHAYKVTMLGDAVVVLGEGYDREPCFLPPLSGRAELAVDRLLDEGYTFYGADDSFLARLSGSLKAELVEDRDNFDYLYLREELAELPGNRFHKKKNRINYFTRKYDCVIDPYGEAYLEGSLRLLDEWGRVRAGLESSSVRLELEANREALELAGTLGLSGLVALVEGEVRGFVFGERLNRETSVCQFEKADPFLDGIYQLLDREFNRRLFTDCTFVNREQDLGEPNLRASKLSYHPLELIRKYRIRRITGEPSLSW